MSDRRATESAADLPKFHIVVRRPSQKGPLAPYRFAISIVVAFVIAFDDLKLALVTGVADDRMLTRAIGAALFTWFVLTVLNRILSQGAPTRASRPSGPGHSDS